MKQYLLLFLFLCAFSACSRNPFTHNFKAAELKPRHAGLYAQEFATQQKKYNEALQKIVQEPENPQHYCALAKVYMYEAAVTGDHPYYYPAALNALNTALEKNTKDIETSILKTSVLLSLHHFAEAKELAQSISNTTIAASAVYGMLCDANVELGQYEEAVQAVDNMMRLRPGLEAYSRVSYLREIHGDMDGALEAMKLAVQAGMPGTNDAAWVRTTLGNLYLHSGRMQEAEAQYQMARSERINYPFALAGLAMLRRSEKNYNEARQLLDTAFAMIPEVSFVEKRVSIERDAGNSKAADSLMVLIEQMLNEDESAGHINHSERALVYSRYNYKVQDALRHAEIEIQQRPDNITAQYAMGYALFRNARYNEARSYMAKALHNNSSDAEMVACAAMIEQSLGNTAEFQRLRERALSLNPRVESLVAPSLSALHE